MLYLALSNKTLGTSNILIANNEYNDGMLWEYSSLITNEILNDLNTYLDTHENAENKEVNYGINNLLCNYTIAFKTDTFDNQNIPLADAIANLNCNMDVLEPYSPYFFLNVKCAELTFKIVCSFENIRDKCTYMREHFKTKYGANLFDKYFSCIPTFYNACFGGINANGVYAQIYNDRRLAALQDNKLDITYSLPHQSYGTQGRNQDTMLARAQKEYMNDLNHKKINIKNVGEDAYTLTHVYATVAPEIYSLRALNECLMSYYVNAVNFDDTHELQIPDTFECNEDNYEQQL